MAKSKSIKWKGEQIELTAEGYNIWKRMTDSNRMVNQFGVTSAIVCFVVAIVACLLLYQLTLTEGARLILGLVGMMFAGGVFMSGVILFASAGNVAKIEGIVEQYRVQGSATEEDEKSVIDSFRKK